MSFGGGGEGRLEGKNNFQKHLGKVPEKNFMLQKYELQKSEEGVKIMIFF